MNNDEILETSSPGNETADVSTAGNGTTETSTADNGTTETSTVSNGTADAPTPANATIDSLADDILSDKINNNTNNLRRLHELNLNNMELVCKGLESLETMEQRLSNMQSKLEKLGEKMIQDFMERFPNRDISTVDEERHRNSFRNRYPTNRRVVYTGYTIKPVIEVPIL